jgi:CDP-6-deoxy-D-xylo-4-hexulose-3-dehydrase
MRSAAARHEPESREVGCAQLAPRDLDFARPFFGEEEREAVRSVMAGHWLASGKQNEQFEREFALMVGVPYALCVNSGSMANLIALASFNLPKGSRVLTSACGFPATLSPILHLGMEPVLVDYQLPSYNIDIEQCIHQIPTVDAIILAHTLGNPADMRELLHFADHFGVQVIEDCCEAIGATLDGQQVGAFSDCGTFSFYPSHQITALGGGGMITFKSETHYHRAKSLRDWGKVATWDRAGRNNTVYNYDVDGIPYFPHYAYANVGWNAKLPEANAAFGREQLKRLDWIVRERTKNHDLILAMLSAEARKCLGTASSPEGSRPSWFGVVLSVLQGDRAKFGNALEQRGVHHRPFFAGNITRHPPFKKYRQKFAVADFLMEKTVFVGCYAGMTEDDCAYVAQSIEESLNEAA